MKKTIKLNSLFFALLLCLTNLVGLAQDNTAQLRTKLDRVFARIDKSQIPTGILEDAGFGWLPLTQLKDTMHIDNATFRMAYESLYSARIAGTQTLPPLAVFNQGFAPRTPQSTELDADDIIDVAVLNYDFNSLRPDAITANLMTANGGQLRDVAGRTQSPYQNHHVFLMTTNLHIADPKEYTGNVHFRLKRSNYFTNTNKTIQKIEADLGNGYWREIQFDQAYYEVYCCINREFGWKTIKYRFTYTDNTVFTSQTKVNIKSGWQVHARYAAFGSRDIPVFDRTGTNQHSGGTMQIVYSQRNPTRQNFPLANRRLMKPLIVIEGFDASSIMPLLAGGDYNVEAFLRGIEASNRDTPPYDFNNQLDDIAGYDLVFLNFNNGTDDIIRNARLLQDVLREVNAMKVPNVNNNNIREQNVVLGLSMGGLVGRYGLAEMEKNRRAGIPNNEHETRLLLTHDSPHRGANVPLGVQSLAEAFRNNSILQELSPDSQQLYRLLDCPAARQMLIYQTNHAGTNSTGQPVFEANTFLDGAYRTMITFPVGQEAPYQFVATSNGSECGTPLFPAYTELVRGTGSAYSFLSPFTLFNPIVANLLNSQNKISGQCIVNALPNRQNRRISVFQLTYSFKILHIIPIDVDIYNYRANSNTTQIPIDGMAGGTFPIGERIPAGLLPISEDNSYVFGLLSYSAFANVADRFTFIPHYSALDIQGTAPSVALLTTAIHSTESPKRSTALNFIPAVRNPNGGNNEFNQAHIQFTNRNAEWLFSQMEQPNPQVIDCFGAICNPNTLQIQSTLPSLCFGATPNLFSINNLPTPAVVNWRANDNRLVNIATPNSPTTVITPSPTARGFVTITAFITSPACNNFTTTLTRRIWVGEMTPISQINSNAVYDNCLTFQETYSLPANQAQGSQTIRWFISRDGRPASEILSAANRRQCSVGINVMPGSCEQVEITVTADNGCSNSSFSESFEYCLEAGRPRCTPTTGGRQAMLTFSVFPNPSSGKLTLSFENLWQKVVNLSVINSLGTQVAHLVNPVLSPLDTKHLTTLDLSTLPDGVYLITVMLENGTTLAQKVVLQKGVIAN